MMTDMDDLFEDFENADPRHRPYGKRSRDPLPDLNTLEIEHDGNFDWPAQIIDPAVETEHVTVHFRKVKNALLDFIDRYPVLFGCVAWLTEQDVLHWLSKKRVAIVVQKEDWLRPDAGGGWNKEQLREAYAKLGNGFNRWDLPPPLRWCDFSQGNEDIEGVRCVGNHNRDRRPAHPRMHHKFLVGCAVRQHKTGDAVWVEPCFGGRVSTTPVAGWERLTDIRHVPFDEEIIPQAVWTGSFNFTYNATLSLENAVEIRTSEIAQAYLQEFAAVAAFSEPLDWTEEWCAPEWRIGT